MPRGIGDGWRTVDQNTRLALWDIHRNFIPARRASQIKITQIDATPITFKREQTTLVLRDEFKNAALCYWERFKIDIIHHLDVEGVVVMTFLRTRDGQIVPQVVAPETYVLQVRHRLLSESAQFRAVRVAMYTDRFSEDREKNVLNLPAMRLDAGIAYPEPGDEDPLVIVLSGYGHDPSYDGSLNSVVASYYEEWAQYKNAIITRGETHHQQLYPKHFVAMGEMNDSQVTATMFSRYSADGTKALRQEENDEARNASLMARDMINKRMLALANRDIDGPPHGEAGITENDPGVLGYTARMMNRNHLVALPPNATLANEYRTYPVVDVETIYTRVSKAVTEAYGVPSGYFDMAANMKGNEALYERVMASTTNATARTVGTVLTEAYNFLHGASICSNELFRVFEDVLKPEMQKQLYEILEENLERAKGSQADRDVQRPGAPFPVTSMRDVFSSKFVESAAADAWEDATRTEFDQQTVDQQILDFLEADIEEQVRHFAGLMPTRRSWASRALSDIKRYARSVRITLEVAGFSRTESLEDSSKRFMFYGASAAEFVASMRQSGKLDETDTMTEEERQEAVDQLTKARKKYFMEFVAADLGIQLQQPDAGGAGSKRPAGSAGAPEKKKPKKEEDDDGPKKDQKTATTKEEEEETKVDKKKKKTPDADADKEKKTDDADKEKRKNKKKKKTKSSD